MTADALPPDVLLAALLAAMESAGLGCTVVLDDEAGLRRAYTNTQAAALFGMTPEQFQRTPPLLAVPPEERERLAAMRRDGGSGVPSLETKIARPDGTVLPVEVSMGTMPLERGRAV